jgi:transmembrane sensor
MHPDLDLLRASAPARRPARRRAFGLRLIRAATAVATVVLVAWWLLPQGLLGPGPAQHFATTADGYERVALEDGSLVELNSNTEVQVHYSDTRRQVRLIRGEAHFTVAKNPHRPFSVEAGLVAVHALGTAFNVRLGPREIEVLVTEGKVRVGGSEVPPPAVPAMQPMVENPAAVAVLGANERARVPTDIPAVTRLVPEKVAPAIVRESLAWQGLRLVFADTPLSDVVAQFNRRNQTQLVVADAELESLAVGGSFRAENVEAFVRLLESGDDVVVDRSTVGLIVLRKAR